MACSGTALPYLLLLIISYGSLRYAAVPINYFTVSTPINNMNLNSMLFIGVETVK
jgi:hypothetical protein